jgi:hypothetical protein
MEAASLIFLASACAPRLLVLDVKRLRVQL